MRLAPALLCASLGAAGCFDAHAVDAGPLIIDDFDDGDYYPAYAAFDPWSCYAFNPTNNKNYSCRNEQRDVDGGKNNFALFLDFTITDVADGRQQSGGASLATYAKKPVDLTKFTEIVFDNRLESGTPALPTDALLYVELGCETVPDTNGDVPGDFYVVKSVGYNKDWGTRKLTLVNLGPPPWINNPIEGGTAGCLSHVDSIRFTVDAQLADGSVGQGFLHIDNVSFQ